MARTPSNMVELGIQAPKFSLLNTEGKLVSLSDFESSPALVVMFICNHCPFVKHIRSELAAISRDWIQRGVAVVGINSNDVENYPEDSPEKMKVEKQSAGYPFDYLYDATQEVARAYGAACTPDFFLFDRGRRLVYRGQLDDSRPGSSVPVSGKDLCSAVDAVLEGRSVASDQKPSLGCNIKWKETR